MVKVFFSIFQFKFSVYYIKFEINNLIVGCCQSFPQLLRFWPPYMNYQILVVYEIGNFRDFSKISRKTNFKNFSIFEILAL